VSGRSFDSLAIDSSPAAGRSASVLPRGIEGEILHVVQTMGNGHMTRGGTISLTTSGGIPSASECRRSRNGSPLGLRRSRRKWGKSMPKLICIQDELCAVNEQDAPKMNPRVQTHPENRISVSTWVPQCSNGFSGALSGRIEGCFPKPYLSSDSLPEPHCPNGIRGFPFRRRRSVSQWTPPHFAIDFIF
jgi:hypothetical protein